MLAYNINYVSESIDINKTVRLLTQVGVLFVIIGTFLE